MADEVVVAAEVVEGVDSGRAVTEDHRRPTAGEIPLPKIDTTRPIDLEVTVEDTDSETVVDSADSAEAEDILSKHTITTHYLNFNLFIHYLTKYYICT